VGGAFLEFATTAPGGTCGQILTAANAVIRNLSCGGLNIGGGASLIPEGAVPDGSTSRFAADCPTNNCTLGPTSTAPAVNTTGPDCTNTGCNFGTPLPIPNPSVPGITSCVLNKWSQPASGTLNLADGSSSTSTQLASDTYITGNLGQPCPKCLPLGTPPFTGTCDRGPRAGMACTSTSATGYSRDCVTGGVGTPTSLCPLGSGSDGKGNGNCCGAVCSDDLATPCTTNADCVAPAHCATSICTPSGSAACTSNADCVAPDTCQIRCNCPCTAGGGNCCDGSHVGVIAINLSPLQTGTSTKNSATGNFCPGQTNTSGHLFGCFGATNCRNIRETGAPAGAITLGTPSSAKLASVFCIPGTGNGLVDASADLPGPGATALSGIFNVHH